MRGSLWLHLMLLFAAVFGVPTLADSDSSLHQVYEAVRTGHLDRAQTMIKRVLHDHPKSAKAHYVAAEISAASGNFVLGRKELRLAQELAPGLPFAESESVRGLQDRLSPTSSVHMPLARETGDAFTWSLLAVLVIAMCVAVAFTSMRRRAPTGGYAQTPEREPSAAAELPTTAAGAGGPSIAGDLAGGLAAGAGIVAVEEIARHLHNSGEHEVTAQEHRESDHFGGLDFGVSGASSWDDHDKASGSDDWN